MKISDDWERRTKLREEKNKLREEYRSKRASLPEETKNCYDSKINCIISGLVSFRFADTIMFYHPMKEEIDILPLAQKALSMNKKVAFPKIVSCGIMDFYFINDMKEDFEPGTWGILEPKTSCEKFEIGQDYGKIMMIIPALSYDRTGNRLGYGKGYYDRYLEKVPVKSIGICYNDFFVQSLPRGCHDKKVDLVVTEKGVTCIG
ncbi:MAG: 5-formyltetrahydrofolate cyclo-ligase [Clostridia bacterium]|nr:5-formyltetrahydrofolate cyclo-ligase [Clostridia bacterium]